MTDSATPPALPTDLPLLPDDWSYMPLSKLIDETRGIRYGIVQPGKAAPLGVPIVRVNNIRSGRVDETNPLRVESAIAEKYHRTCLEGGEVLLTLVGTVGETAIVPQNMAGWNVARAVAVLPVNGDVSSDWVNLCLRSSLVQHYIRTWCTTTVQATFNLRDVARLPIPIPPKKERRRIADILGTLDDKIELNRRMNETLEAMARRLFKSWFVDFDPVRAKAALREKHPKWTNNRLSREALPKLDPKIAELFPDALVDSELGEIPKGWRVMPLDDVANFQNGLALQRFRPKEDEEPLPIVKIAQLKAGLPTFEELASPSIKPECIIRDGDLVFSWSGSLMIDYWCGGKAALNQHLFKVTSVDFPKWFYAGWTTYHLKEFQRIAADKAVTMGHIKREHLSSALCVIPEAPLPI